MEATSIIAGLIVLSLLFNPVGDVDQTNPAQEINLAMASDNVTTATELLQSLPVPEERLALAVYDIEDKTGQFKEEEYLTNSKAVTQGATEMLITALMRSKQFDVLDRVEFQQMLNELNLVNQNFTDGKSGPTASQMTGADYIIEGAITEYDVDRNTGGIGLKIAGKGASKEYARATCAIDLRVTDTTTGKVIWAKSLKKEILGEKVDVTVFSFMGDNIVEFETGKGMQQAINLVVRTLLEEAVYQMAKDIYGIN